MAETAYQKQYRQEFIMGFEDAQSRLRSTCTTEAMLKGNEAIFLVARSAGGTGSASAVSRGVNGLITARADDLTQSTATLKEWHDLVRKTGFNIFASQGNQKRIMQDTSMGTINRKIDDDIIAQLDTATNDTGTAQPPTLNMVAHAMTVLGNNFVDISDEDNVFGVISPGFFNYLMQIPEFASADFVEVKPFGGTAKKFRRWYGINWLVHPRLTNSIGAGGSSTSEQNFVYHRNAIGHAVDKGGMEVVVGYDEEQQYSFARTSIYMGTKLLQNSGVVMLKADTSAYAAA